MAAITIGTSYFTNISSGTFTSFDIDTSMAERCGVAFILGLSATQATITVAGATAVNMGNNCYWAYPVAQAGSVDINIYRAADVSLARAYTVVMSLASHNYANGTAFTNDAGNGGSAIVSCNDYADAKAVWMGYYYNNYWTDGTTIGGTGTISTRHAEDGTDGKWIWKAGERTGIGTPGTVSYRAMTAGTAGEKDAWQAIATFYSNAAGQVIMF